MDDGETGAGDKLLWLLEQRKEQNTIVMVTRWYGGIHLGNDRKIFRSSAHIELFRFKHIVNLAKEALDKLGCVEKPGKK